MRVHVLALSHTKVLRVYSACAFTNKCRLLSKMLHDRGHTVYLYAPQGSEAQCSELVPVLDEATFQQVHGGYDWRRDGFRLGRDNLAYAAFRDNAIREIAARAQPGDVLCCTFGLDHQPITDAVSRLVPGIIVVESGIGYDHCFALNRVYESQAWLHFHLGKEGRGLDPSWQWVVIPNAYDLADYPWPPFTISEKECEATRHLGPLGPSSHDPKWTPTTSLQPPRWRKGDYLLFVGRPNPLKGLDIARDVARTVGLPLVTAGQGTPDQWEGTHHLGVLSIEERAKWMAGARALLAPTQYVEPWGNVVVEAQLCGTAVICTDWGGFTENVVQGVTGFRCRTFAQFVHAAEHADEIRPLDCRRHAEQCSLERIGARYENYFSDLLTLHTDPRGWHSLPAQVE